MHTEPFPSPWVECLSARGTGSEQGEIRANRGIGGAGLAELSNAKGSELNLKVELTVRCGFDRVRLAAFVVEHDAGQVDDQPSHRCWGA